MSLIMPKQTGERNRFEASLAIYYEHRFEGWVNNDDFKTEIIIKCPELEYTKKDDAMLVKQSEICRYFGLVERPSENMSIRKARITARGIKFHEALISQDKRMQTQIIFQSLAEDSFGRNNSAVPTSNSRIDPPVVFLKAVQELGGINRTEFAYILYQMHDNSIDYKEVIEEIKRMRLEDDDDFNMSQDIRNKYNDVKFVVFFKDFETKIILEDNHKYYLESYIDQNYGEFIEDLSPYNDVDDGVKSGLAYKDIDSIDNSEIYNILESEQEKRETEYARPYENQHDLSERNNRAPETVEVAAGKKYKTDARIRKTAIKNAQYKCEMDNEHPTFLNNRNKPYMEAHHLIPMEQQGNFANKNIDRSENIVSLCSNCHNQIHYGNHDEKQKVLNKLFNARKEALAEQGINISEDDIKHFYGL